MFELQSLNLVTCQLTNYVELAFQSVRHHDVGAAADKDLADDRGGLQNRLRHLDGSVDGNVSPA